MKFWLKLALIGVIGWTLYWRFFAQNSIGIANTVNNAINDFLLEQQNTIDIFSDPQVGDLLIANDDAERILVVRVTTDWVYSCWSRVPHDWLNNSLLQAYPKRVWQSMANGVVLDYHKRHPMEFHSCIHRKINADISGWYEALSNREMELTDEQRRILDVVLQSRNGMALS